jgi:hypothetical protein
VRLDAEAAPVLFLRGKAMTSRRIAFALFVCLVATLSACHVSDTGAPRAGRLSRDFDDSSEADFHIPGSRRSPFSLSWDSDKGQVLACSRREAQTGSAVIGPNGGTLVVGNNQLIIPPGALQEETRITGTVPADTIASIHFEPEGLRFRKPAGLQLDATGCARAEGQPSILYLDDNGNVLEKIDAVYSNWWHSVAAPIEHFSVYAIGV